MGFKIFCMEDPPEKSFEYDDQSERKSGVTAFDRLFPRGYPDAEKAAQKASQKAEAKEAKKRKRERKKQDGGSSSYAPAPEKLHRSWILVPILLFLGGASLVFFTQKDIGYSWDEAYYYEPSLKAGDWLAAVFSGEGSALRGSVRDEYWKERSEHPSFHKLITGVSLYHLEDTLGPIAAMRLPAAVLFGLTLVLLYAIGRRTWSAPAGIAAALAYACMPRVFGHAHFSSLETPLLFATLLTIYCYIRGLNSIIWATLTGASLGLLVATKINGFFLIPPLILWGQMFARQRYINNLFCMMVIGPVFFVGLWPWLWSDTPVRILDYLSFHATHQHTALFFEGQKWGYGAETAPWYYPSAMIAYTLPISVLILGSIGILYSLVRAPRRSLPILFLFVALVNLAVASAPSTPRYDGVRLFLPVFPFLALMAGGGAHALLRGFDAVNRGRNSAAVRASMVWLILLVLVAEGGWALISIHPHYLSYFNPIVGGLEGANERGFEVTYWGEAVNQDVIDTLNREIPDGESVRVLALHDKCFEHHQKWGNLKSTIRIGGTPPHYAHLLLHREGFYTRAETALAKSDAFPPIAEWGHHGVPLVSLHKTGAEFDAFWPHFERLQALEAAAEPQLPPPPEPGMAAQPQPSTNNLPTTQTAAPEAESVATTATAKSP